MIYALNLAVHFGSAFAGLVAAHSPTALSRSLSLTHGERFYQCMYSVRALPWEILAGILPFYFDGPAVTAVVATSGLVQLADVIIGLVRRDMGQATGALIGTVVHITCFAYMEIHDRRFSWSMERRRRREANGKEKTGSDGQGQL